MMNDSSVAAVNASGFQMQGLNLLLGGMTSHAAVVARGMGKPCVAGAGALSIDYRQGRVTVVDSEQTVVVNQGDYITLDGSTGEFFVSELETQDPEVGGDFQTLISWANEFRNDLAPTRGERRRYDPHG
jgi:pyruvate, orthophosphate dikinase